MPWQCSHTARAKTRTMKIAMKNKIRASVKNTIKQAPAQPEKPSIHGQDSPLRQLKDSDLDEEASRLNAEERLELAKKLKGWARELERSCEIESPQGGPLVRATDEIKAAVRSIFEHLSLSEGDMDGYFAEAKRLGSDCPFCLDWYTIAEWITNPN